MDIVTKLMSALPEPVDAVTWLPREQSKLYPNGTAISTYGSFTDFSDAIAVVLNRYSWKNIGMSKLNSFQKFEPPLGKTNRSARTSAQSDQSLRSAFNG